MLASFIFMFLHNYLVDVITLTVDILCVCFGTLVSN